MSSETQEQINSLLVDLDNRLDQLADRSQMLLEGVTRLADNQLLLDLSDVSVVSVIENLTEAEESESSLELSNDVTVEIQDPAESDDAQGNFNESPIATSTPLRSSRYCNRRERSRSPIEKGQQNAAGPSCSTSQASTSPKVDQSNLQNSFGECAVCLDSFLKNQPYSTICGHVFCKMCILNAVEVKKACPLCRNFLTNKSLHPLHL